MLDVGGEAIEQRVDVGGLAPADDQHGDFGEGRQLGVVEPAVGGGAEVGELEDGVDVLAGDLAIGDQLGDGHMRRRG